MSNTHVCTHTPHRCSNRIKLCAAVCLWRWSNPTLYMWTHILVRTHTTCREKCIHPCCSWTQLEVNTSASDHEYRRQVGREESVMKGGRGINILISAGRICPGYQALSLPFLYSNHHRTLFLSKSAFSNQSSQSGSLSIGPVPFHL